MTDHVNMLSTSEYSKLTGITVRTITQMLREGKLSGEKRGGKWAIYAAERQHAVSEERDVAAALVQVIDTPSTRPNIYDIATFAQLTYLTEKGVRQWLKTGRLSGTIESGREAFVDAGNLDRPELQHLIRK